MRELEKEIEKSLNEELAYHGGDITGATGWESTLQQKTGVRHNTLAGYKTVANILKKGRVWRQTDDTVKVSDANSG